MSANDQKIALVTGANRGIGFETCRQLAIHGLRAILTSRDPIKGQSAAESLRREGLAVDYHALDVTDLDSIYSIYEDIQEKFGRLDVLVNNSGVYLDEGDSVFKVPMEVFRETMEVGKKAVNEEMSVSWDLADAQKALILIAGPSGELNMRGYMAFRHWIDLHIGGFEVRSGDYPVSSSRFVAVAVILSGFLRIARVDTLRAARDIKRGKI